MADNRMAMDGLRAFDRAADGSWKQTPETKKVLDIVRQAGGKDFKIEAAPSVITGADGMGIWGTGGGVHYPDGSGTFVDPVKGNVSTAAHEAAHASFPTELVSAENQAQAFEKLNTMNAAPLGNQARAVYETMSKPIMLEEANAQGVAAGAMNKAGFQFNTNGWQGHDMRETGLSDDVPAAWHIQDSIDMVDTLTGGEKAYESVQGIGENGRDYTAGERQSLDRTRQSHLPAMKRQFQKGYDLIK